MVRPQDVPPLSSLLVHTLTLPAATTVGVIPTVAAAAVRAPPVRPQRIDGNVTQRR